MEERTTMAAVGDIFLGRRVEHTINQKGSGYLFDSVKSFLHGNDIVVGNLESPVSSIRVPDRTKRLIARPTSLDDLKEASFNAVSIANNHIMDFGLPGLRDTITELNKRHIGHAGAGLNKLDAQRPLRSVAGKRVTLLAYYGIGGRSARGSAGPNRSEFSKVLGDIREAHGAGDLVLVFIHWGRAINLPMKHQVEYAHHMIDQGANAILGSGPHVLQPIEQYNGGVIAYSLGDFVFDLRRWEESLILQMVFNQKSLERVNIIPIGLSHEHRPEPIDPVDNPAAYKRIQSLLVPRLDTFASDARIIAGNLTLVGALKKLVLKKHKAYSFSHYLNGVRQLIKERWLSRK